MSPAVSTATARAAAGDRPQAPAEGDAEDHPPGRQVEQRRLFQLGLDRPEPDPDDQHDPGQGRHRMDERRARPARPGSGPSPSACAGPALPNAPSQAVAMQRHRHERRQGRARRASPAGPRRRSGTGRTPAATPERQRDRLGRQHEPDRLDRQPPAAGRLRRPSVATAVISPPAGGPRGLVAVEDRRQHRPAEHRDQGQRSAPGRADPRSDRSSPAAPPPSSGRPSTAYASRTQSTILSGSGEYSSSIEIVASSSPRPLIASQVRGEVDHPAARRAGRRGPCRRSRRCGRGPPCPRSRSTSSAGCWARTRCEMSRFAFTAGWSTSSRNRAMLVDVVQEREVERLQLQGDLQAEVGGVLARASGRARRPSPTARPAGSPRFCQMYSPRTSRTFFASNR